MNNNKYPNLTSPITLGKVTFRNRIFSAPMGATDITADCCPGPRTQGFYELRAKGEVRILIDAKAKTAVGGTGLTVDRELAQKVSKKTKLWLAGGIGPSNVKEIVQELSPELIDINSGVESAPGKKDSNLLLEFFDALA